MATEPKSALHFDGWVALLIVIGFCVMPIGKSVKDTLYYKYRPANQWHLNPGWIWFFWTAALVLVGVSWYYLFTITSTTGNWPDRLFVHQDHPWDGMMSLYLVAVFLIKMWSSWVYWLDNTWAHWAGRPNAPGKPESAYQAVSSGASEKRTPVGSDDAASIVRKHELYFIENWPVQWGMFFYAAALVAVFGTITGSYSRLYAEQRNDQWFKIIYWTVFVGLFVSVFGWIYTCFTAWYYKAAKDRHAELRAIVDDRNVENQLF
jgi:hypothetical protein